MRKGLWLAVSLLAVTAPLMGGCVGQPSEPPPASPPATHLAEPPEGMKSPRKLTNEEQAKVIDIAFNSLRVLYYRGKYSAYEIELAWIGITGGKWEPSGVEPSDVTIVYLRDLKLFEEEGKKASEIFQGSEWIFPGVVINFGEPPELQVCVAVDLGTETAIDVFYSPLLPLTPPRP